MLAGKVKSWKGSKGNRGIYEFLKEQVRNGWDYGSNCRARFRRNLKRFPVLFFGGQFGLIRQMRYKKDFYIKGMGVFRNVDKYTKENSKEDSDES